MNAPVKTGGSPFVWKFGNDVVDPDAKQQGPEKPLHSDGPLPLNTQKTSTPPRQKAPQLTSKDTEAPPLETHSPPQTQPPPVTEEPGVAAKVLGDPKSATPQEQAECEGEIVCILLGSALALADSPMLSEQDRALWSGHAAALNEQLVALDNETPPPSWETRQKRIDQSLMTQMANVAEWLSGMEALPPADRESQGQLAVAMRAGVQALQGEKSSEKSKEPEPQVPETDLSGLPGAFPRPLPEIIITPPDDDPPEPTV